MKYRKLVILLFIMVSVALLIGTTADNTLKRTKLGLDLQGGFEVLYQVERDHDKPINEEVIKSTISALQSRVNIIGVSEPNIQPEGKDRIRVQLAGVKDQSQARRILSTEAQLSFRDVHDRLMMDGTELQSAKLAFDEQNQPIVSIELKDPNRFAEITREISSQPSPENLLVIWLDYEKGLSFQDERLKPKDQQKIISTPAVHQELNHKTVMIEGNFTTEEAKELASILNAGALPVKLTEIYSQSISAQFGGDALTKTTNAGIVGIALVFLFMLVYYRLPGFISILTLCAYIYLILVIFDWMNGVLTLPGIAALILGVGMAVDANIITYERMKDEIGMGRSLRQAFRAGSKRSFITILDANLTTILAGIVLFVFGTSAVKGFATMLILSILVSFITAVFGSRVLLGLLVNSQILNHRLTMFGMGLKKASISSPVGKISEFKTSFNFDFVKHRKKFYLLSILFFTIGLTFFINKGLSLGIDFSSGTRVEVYSKDSINVQEVKETFSQLGYTVDVTLSGEKKNIGVALMIGDLSQEEVAKVKQTFVNLYDQEPNISVVSPMVGKELAKNALLATLIASLGIVLYVTIRYEWTLALTAVLALLHDALFIILMFSFLQIEVNLYFIAAILTIIGYSINDTMVTYDRMNEHLKEHKIIKSSKQLKDIVNMSLQQTMGRSINTVLTVIFTALSLYIFGSEAIRGFSFALLIGLFAGTFSSLFIASQLWFDIKKKKLSRGSLTYIKEPKTHTDEPVI